MNFAPSIVAWQNEHGRHGLPWQQTRDPYRIWLSEIMLQQTQVSTVIPYYLRFLERFPDVATLAAATQEDVMPYWAGLGYYARARNLHRCAQALAQDWGGRFPPDAQTIAAFSYGERSPIMDGNVERVFTRHFGVEGVPALRAVEQRLWTLAEAQVEQAPGLDMAAYTQGLMDLGATVCTRGKPLCERCPVRATCIACRDGRQQELPTPKPRKVIPERQTGMLVLHYAGAILLQQRPEPGIWGGLWSLPEFDPQDSPLAAARTLGLAPREHYELAAFAHTFSHYRLHIRPCYVPLPAPGLREPGAIPERWVQAAELDSCALPAPVKKLLTGLFETDLPG